MAQFATSDELASRLGVEFSSEDSTRADGLLETASGLIKDVAKQDLELVEDDVLTRRGVNADRFRLPQRPVEAVTLVKLDGETLAADEYYLAGDQLVKTTGVWGSPLQELEVTYTHGYAAMPESLKAICIEAVVRVWVNPGAVQSENYGGESVNYGRETGLLLTLAEERAIRRAIAGTPKAGTINLR